MPEREAESNPLLRGTLSAGPTLAVEQLSDYALAGDAQLGDMNGAGRQNGQLRSSQPKERFATFPWIATPVERLLHRLEAFPV